jgi:hypothetical protein
LNNRLEQICDRLLTPNQIAFVKGRYLLESVVSAHEILHDSMKRKEKGLILKLDYKKAYDIVTPHVSKPHDYVNHMFKRP